MTVVTRRVMSAYVAASSALVPSQVIADQPSTSSSGLSTPAPTTPAVPAVMQDTSTPASNPPSPFIGPDDPYYVTLSAGYDFINHRGAFNLLDPKGTLLHSFFGTSYTPLTSFDFQIPDNGLPKQNYQNIEINDALLTLTGQNWIRDGINTFLSGVKSYDIGYGLEKTVQAHWLQNIGGFNQWAVTYDIKQDDSGVRSQTGRVASELKFNTQLLSFSGREAPLASLLIPVRAVPGGDLKFLQTNKAKRAQTKALTTIGPDVVAEDDNVAFRALSRFRGIAGAGAVASGFNPQTVRRPKPPEYDDLGKEAQDRFDKSLADMIDAIADQAPGIPAKTTEPATETKVSNAIVVSEVKSSSSTDLATMDAATRQKAQQVAVAAHNTTVAQSVAQQRLATYAARIYELRDEPELLVDAAYKARLTKEPLSLNLVAHDQLPNPRPDPRLTLNLQAFGYEEFNKQAGPNGYLNAQLIFYFSRTPGQDAATAQRSQAPGICLSYIAGAIPSSLNNGLHRASIDLIIPLRY